DGIRDATVTGVQTCALPISGVDYLLNKSHGWYVGGRVEGLQLPTHYDFRTLRLTPSDLRAEFVRVGWRRIVGFQTRNPMHRAHEIGRASCRERVERGGWGAS